MQSALARTMLQAHMDDKGSLKTHDRLFGFTRDSLTGAIKDSGINVVMKASRLLQGLTNGAQKLCSQIASATKMSIC